MSEVWALSFTHLSPMVNSAELDGFLPTETTSQVCAWTFSKHVEQNEVANIEEKNARIHNPLLQSKKYRVSHSSRIICPGMRMGSIVRRELYIAFEVME
ncbi:hypothetical protein KIN20_019043 [Parelaphostrongylus tenuis]|uniref:Uncharacterized protein n=1 Tax=Parelaphostrongylus tenuis TaxID=148309 RepID=A0AAD5MKB4_PARTN|nr:hypothetical protein KIN20_019043 [Parelaphostrongylus tenuis]